MRRSEPLKARTEQFALRIIRLYRSLPKSEQAHVIGKQLLRAATSAGPNCRSACIYRSKSEFVAKLGVVLQEAGETVFWLELLIEAQIVHAERLQSLMTEANELTAIFVVSLRTAKAGTSAF